MDYAQKAAIFRKVLIIASRSSNPAVAMRDEVRFQRFAAILGEAGFSPLHAYADSIAQLAALVDRFKPDIVFSAPDHLPVHSHSPVPSSLPPVNVHAWLEETGIPYVGSPPAVIELALSKTDLKEKWKGDAILTSPFYSFDSNGTLSFGDKGRVPPFPCIVKPSDAGNSRGITKDSVVFDAKSLDIAVEKLSRNFRHILIEHYLGLYPDFREITCACVGNGQGRLLMPAEIVFLEPTRIRVVTTEDKDGHATSARSIGDEGLRDTAKAFAGKALASTGVQDYSRCDIAFADGRFWAIEVNGQPMIPDPWFEACASHAGLTESQYIIAIFMAAICRWGGEVG